MQIDIGRIIRVHTSNGIRVYQVTGVYLGSARQEHLVGIKVLDKYSGVNGKEDVKEMLVPVDIIEILLHRELEMDLNYEKETKWKEAKRK